MKLIERISECIENATIDIYSSTASQFLWGEIEAPVELKDKVDEKSDNMD